MRYEMVLSMPTAWMSPSISLDLRSSGLSSGNQLTEYKSRHARNMHSVYMGVCENTKMKMMKKE